MATEEQALCCNCRPLLNSLRSLLGFLKQKCLETKLGNITVLCTDSGRCRRGGRGGGVCQGQAWVPRRPGQEPVVPGAAASLVWVPRDRTAAGRRRTAPPLPSY